VETLQLLHFKNKKEKGKKQKQKEEEKMMFPLIRGVYQN